MNSDNNSVCVIVRAYNAAMYISECLLSLRNQTYQFDIFVKILYDKGSTDSTQQVLQKLDLLSLNTRNRHFTLIEHENLSPFRSLFNYGLEKFARSFSYYAILDYDNYYDLDYIESAIGCLANNKSQFLYSLPKFVDKSKRELPVKYKIPTHFTIFLKYRIILRNFIDASTIFMTASCLDSILTKIRALRSKTFDWIYEDWIIGALALTYCKSYFLNSPRVYYRIHETNTTFSNIENSQNGTNSNRDILSISALRLLMKNDPVAKIFCVVYIFKWTFYSFLDLQRKGKAV